MTERPIKICTVPGCGGMRTARGLCPRHYQQDYLRRRAQQRHVTAGDQLAQHEGQPPQAGTPSGRQNQTGRKEAAVFVALELPAGLQARAQAQARQRGLSLSEYLRRFLADALLAHEEVAPEIERPAEKDRRLL